MLHARSLQNETKQINIGKQTLATSSPKKPLPERIEYGELAVNFGKGSEALFLKNSQGEVIQLNSLKNIRYDGELDPVLQAYFDNEYVNADGDTMTGTLTIEGENSDFIFNGRDFKVDAKRDVNVEFGGTMNITSEGDCSNGKGVLNIKPCTANIAPKKELNLTSENVNISGDTVNVNGKKEVIIETPSLTEKVENYHNTSKNATFDGNVTVQGDTHLHKTQVDGDMNVSGTTTLGETIIKENLTVEKKITANNVEVKNNLTVNKNLTVGGETKFEGKIIFNGDTEFGKNTIIDGANIKPNSITSEQVKDGSLRGVDLEDGTITSDKLAKGVFDAYVKKSGDTMSGNLDNSARIIGKELEAREKAILTNSVTIVKKENSETNVITADGNVDINGTIKAKNQVYSSDERLKKDIKPISEEELEMVSRIELKEYSFKEDNVKRYGIIAQDLEKEGLTNLVFQADEQGMKGVDYVSFLILKVKQLEDEIKKLKK